MVQHILHMIGSSKLIEENFLTKGVHVHKANHHKK